MNHSKYPHKVIWKNALKIAVFGLLIPLLCINVFFILMYLFHIDGDKLEVLIWGSIGIIPITYSLVYLKTLKKLPAQN
jgi:hypothetical protein